MSRPPVDIKQKFQQLWNPWHEENNKYSGQIFGHSGRYWPSQDPILHLNTQITFRYNINIVYIHGIYVVERGKQDNECFLVCDAQDTQVDCYDDCVIECT